MKKTRKIRYKRRLLIYTSLVFLIIFSIIDYYFETAGLPAFAESYVKEKLRVSGFDINFDVLKCGVVNGIVLTHPSLKDSQFSNEQLFTAEKMRLSLRPDFSGSFFLSLNAFEISNGEFMIPFFPDMGEEGKADCVKIKEVNAGISLTGKGLEIRYFSGKLDPFSFSAAGSLKNVLLPIISTTAVSSSSKKFPSSFSAVPAINSIPYQTRARIFRELIKIRDKRAFKGPPECRFVFNIDALSPELSRMNADVNLPEFEYAGLRIKKIDSIISFKNKMLFLDKMFIKLPDTGELHVSGTMDNDTGLISGMIKGKLTPSELAAILKIADLKLPAVMDFTKNISFQLDLKDFSIDAMASKGKLNIEIPEIRFKGVDMFDIKSEFSLNDNVISASKLSFATERNKVNGSFDYYIDDQSVDASIQCSGPPLFIAKILEGDELAMMNGILSRFTFPEKDKNIEISAEVHCSWKDKFFYFITGNMVMHDFKYFDSSFNSGDARIIIDSNELLIIPMMSLVQQKSLATLAMVYDNSTGLKYNVSSPEFSADLYSNRFLSEIQSSLPGKDVLNCIFPEWKSEALDMSELINMKAGGIIDFSDGDIDKTDFKVEIFDSACKWYAIPITQLNCDLIFKGMNMEIKNVRGKVYNGDLSLFYKTNFNTNKGKIEVNLTKSDFIPIAKHADWDLQGDVGKISVVTDADFEYDDNDNLLMTGSGNVKVRDSNLWEVPIINEFGKLTSQWIGDRWGVISDLDADFEFRKDHLYSENIQTNGNVIALRSEGEYYWSTGNFDFLIHAEILKSVLPFKIISKMLDPISGLLESRVTRGNGKIKWKKVKLSDKMFQDNKK